MRSITDKTLEQLENNVWENPGNTSGLVGKIHELRKKPLKDYSTEDLRISIGQNCSLDYLIPLAIEKLKINILSEGDFYPGDLLKMVLESDEQYWILHKNDWSTVKELFETSSHLFEKDSIYQQITDNFTRFKSINE